MSTKDDVIAWGDGVALFRSGKFQEATQVFAPVTNAVGAKMHFNIGMCFQALKRYNEAIASFTAAVKADKYFAVAFFQRGYCQVQCNAFGKAVQDYGFAYENLRGNQFIDYTQLGMAYQLYIAEVLYNRGLCKFKLNDPNNARLDLQMAVENKALPEHDRIDEALRSMKFSGPFFLSNMIYTPPEQKLKNAGKVDYLGNSKIVANLDADNIIGFKDAQLRKMAASPPPSSSPPPSASSRPPPPQSRPPTQQSQQQTQGFSAPSSKPPPPQTAPPSSGSGRAGPASTPFSAPSAAVSSQSSASSGYQAPAPLASGTKIKVKCHFKDTRVVLIEEGIRFEELQKRVQEKFEGAKLKLKYKDEDQDLVLLTDQEDLEMAFSLPDTAAGKMELWCYQ